MNRLRELRKSRHMTQADLSCAIGVSQISVSNWENEKNEIGNFYLIRLSEFFGVSIDYILGLEKPNILPSNISPVGEVVTMSILSSVRGGYDGRAVVEFSDEKAAFLRSAFKGYPPEDCSVLRVRGGSMYPKIEDGDLVLVHRTPSVDSGQIAVIIYNSDEATIKRVRYEPGEDWLELIPINPEYEIKRISGPDLEICRIFGEVIAMQRSF